MSYFKNTLQNKYKYSELQPRKTEFSGYDTTKIKYKHKLELLPTGSSNLCITQGQFFSVTSYGLIH